MYKKFFKPIFDRSLAFILIILFLPVMAVVAILIFLWDGRAVIFRQKRPGKDEKIFEIYKFRTMTNECDENGNLLPDEQRLKGIGKFIRSTSLDELPQLFNVLKGDMSFVGPRPLLVEYLPLYNETQRKRHNVLPGITGWAQVNGRNAISWEQKFEYDVWYVENQSFLLDMKILWMTFLKVVKRSGISQEGQATMEKFKGSKKYEKY
jgi:lipopolysaccharide/colanic/teichoic acid biosynthesis glycosyltransferase